jgi:hypothetical protein
MRWKLLRRRLSVSAPRMIVRSRLPWPVRWAVAALMLGFSAAIALWAFEFGKSIAGLDRDAKAELAQLRAEAARLRQESEQAQVVSNTAESLLKAGQVAQERLAEQLRQLESEKQSLQADLAFFERLLPASDEALQVRGLQVQAASPRQLRYQLLLAQNGKQLPEFTGRYELVLSGQLDGRPWTLPGSVRAVTVRQVARLEGVIDHPAAAVIKTVQARVMDANGATQATRTLKP